jgi:large subunit ribosomal protein L25
MKFIATTRNLHGTGASRRLRHQNKVPGIVYGGEGKPVSIEIDHNPLIHALRVEAFHSSILEMELDGTPERVLLRDVQWHPFKQQIRHIDFQRVSAGKPIHTFVPFHFINAELSPAVKLSGALINHPMVDVEISCLPRHLPEFIAIDLAEIKVGDSIHLSDVIFPEGVKPLPRGKENPLVVTATMPAIAGASEDEEVAEEPTEVAPVEPVVKPAADKK